MVEGEESVTGGRGRAVSRRGGAAGKWRGTGRTWHIPSTHVPGRAGQHGPPARRRTAPRKGAVYAVGPASVGSAGASAETEGQGALCQG